MLDIKEQAHTQVLISAHFMFLPLLQWSSCLQSTEFSSAEPVPKGNSGHWQELDLSNLVVPMGDVFSWGMRTVSCSSVCIRLPCYIIRGGGSTEQSCQTVSHTLGDNLITTTAWVLPAWITVRMVFIILSEHTQCNTQDQEQEKQLF